jgi:hypothetical protein
MPVSIAYQAARWSPHLQRYRRVLGGEVVEQEQSRPGLVHLAHPPQAAGGHLVFLARLRRERVVQLPVLRAAFHVAEHIDGRGLDQRGHVIPGRAGGHPPRIPAWRGDEDGAVDGRLGHRLEPLEAGGQRLQLGQQRGLAVPAARERRAPDRRLNHRE